MRVKAFLPNPLPPLLNTSELGELMSSLMNAQTLLIRLEGKISSLPSATAFLGPMNRREVIYSSRIENTFASLEGVATVDPSNPPNPKSSKQEQRLEVYNNQQALEHGMKSDLPMSLRLLRDMHKRLMWIVGENKSPGEFRRIHVGIGDENTSAVHARFIPPPPGVQLEECLSAFEKFLHPDQYPRQRYEMLIEVAMAHYQFETIHPFWDGNGRLGRVLIPLWPYKAGLLKFPLPNISKVLCDRRQEYYDRLLDVSVNGNWVGWIDFCARTVADSCLSDLERAEKLGQPTTSIGVRSSRKVPN